MQQVIEQLTTAAMPAELVSRDVERQRIDTFWRTHVEEKRPGSLYIRCGAKSLNIGRAFMRLPSALLNRVIAPPLAS